MFRFSKLEKSLRTAAIAGFGSEGIQSENSRDMIGGRKSVIMQRDIIHHGVFPDASSPSGEHGGESYGETRMQLGSSESSCLSCRTSPSSDASNQRDDEVPMDTSWTDDKHSSYLSSMEEMFVRNMYDREYCAMDICGEAASSSCTEQDCVESKLPSSCFKIMQHGGWQPFPCGRLHSWELPSPTILSSPWMQQLKPKTGTAAIRDTQTVDEPMIMERILCRTSTAYELEDDNDDDDDDGEEDVAEVPDVENRSSAWLDRINSHSSASSTSNRSTSTSDTGRSRKTSI